MPPKQLPTHGFSQASSSQHAAGPSRYYVLCEHIANHLPNDFKVGRGMSAVLWSGPQASGDPHPPVTLWVQARNHRDPKPTRTKWDVVVPNEGLVNAIKRLVRLGFPGGPQGSIAVFTDGEDESTEALFQFRTNKKNKTRPDDPLIGDFIPEPEPPEVIIRGRKHHLVSLADFFLRDRLFDVWEGRIADRKFHAVNEVPQYSLLLHETYWMVENGKRTKKVNIALYMAQEAGYQRNREGANLSVIINKPLLEKLLKAAENGPGDPGLHHLKACFIWQLTEGVVKDGFAPAEVLNDSSSSSSASPEPSSSSSSSGRSEKPKVGTSTTFGSRPQGTPKQTALQARTSLRLPDQPPFSDFYNTCKYIAKNLKDFNVYNNANFIAWEKCPEKERTDHSKDTHAALLVQARHEIKNASCWQVIIHENKKVNHELGRLIRRGPPDGPQSSFSISIQDKGESHDVLFLFKVVSGSARPPDPPSKERLPEPGNEPPALVIIKDLHHPLASLADFLLRVDHEFDAWEGHPVDRVFLTSTKQPKYSLIMHETYYKVEDGQTTKHAGIALYLARDDSVKEERFKVNINKELLEKLLEVAKNGQGEPGLHFKRGRFIWQYTEDPKGSPPKFIDYNSSSSSFASPEPSSSSSGSSPGPDPGPGPSHQGPPSPSQKRVHSRSGSDAGSKKPKVGTSSTFGSGHHTSASGSHQPSGSTSHPTSTSGPHTSSQQGSQHGLSGTFQKNMQL